ncbi:MAG: hypothetical protein K8L91_28640 [Anaerolineae bacterium]|nr:hypothetical protein [Anaerolineae bacterium]
MDKSPDQVSLFEDVIRKLERYGWKIEEQTQTQVSFSGILLTGMLGIVLFTSILGIFGSIINMVIFSHFLRPRKIDVYLSENGHVKILGDSINISIINKLDLITKFETNRIRAIQSKKYLMIYTIFVGVGITLIYLWIIIAPIF